MKSASILLTLVTGCALEASLVPGPGEAPLVTPAFIEVPVEPGCHPLQLQLLHTSAVADVTWLGEPVESIRIPRVDSLLSPTLAAVHGSACHEGWLDGHLVVTDTVGRAQLVPIVLAADTGGR